jgi:bifunctional NMN adenylyltransferase/nudix hydrolase
MSNNRPDYVVFIGRFQPFHNGHQMIIDAALKVANRKVIVLVGSVNKPRSIKNPFDEMQRTEMIFNGYSLQDRERIRVGYVADNMYKDDVWIRNVQEEVARIIATDGWTDYPPKIAIIGHEKDETSFYLKFFPQWQSIDIEPGIHEKEIHATDIRELLFSRTESKMNYIKGVVSDRTYADLVNFRKTKEWEELATEFEFIQKYKKSWESAPYAPVFVTTDAVVVQDGHVLMVRRGASPGKGLWALPGGFLNPNERIREGAIRELIEETKIKVPEKILRRSIVEVHVFDHPGRSLRGRTITHAFYFKLDSVGELPKVKGSDDAAHAEWIPLNVFDKMEKEVFEDHFHIVKYFVGD